jgi:hypothetical protein
MITYPIEALLTSGVLMFLCQLEARRQIGLKLRTSRSAKTYATLFNIESFPHGDTLADLSKRINVTQTAHLPTKMVEGLIRKKVFWDSRLFGQYYTIAIDGSGTFRFNSRHCDYCLTTTHGDKTQYYHNVLEAKLVTEDGFSFSLMTEFIENGPTDNPSKQDCELRAFYRLTKRLKKRFKRLPICLLLDALFANGHVFGICRANGWPFLITLKDDQLKTVNQEYERLKELNPENYFSRKTGKKKEITQNYAWVNDIAFTDSTQNNHYVNVFECKEFKPGKNGDRSKRKFKFITNLSAHRENVVALTKGGRTRWKIENQGFNIQKNGGYGLKHAYSENLNGFKVFYHLMQIAHIIAQLIQRGSLFKNTFPKGLGGLANLAFCFLEAWRMNCITPDSYQAMIGARIQIRFNTS